MKWSLKLGTYAGVGFYLHWTFALLIGWIFLVHLGPGRTVTQALAGVDFILALFLCVVLHEFDRQGIAILLGIVGFFFNPFLIFIAIFVYLGAQAEAAHLEAQSALEGLRVRDAMMTRFRTLTPQDSLGRAVEELLAGSQQDFPVVEDGNVAGILHRNDLVKALSNGRRDASVGEAMCRECQPANEADLLTRTLEAMRAHQCATVPVLGGGQLVGLLIGGTATTIAYATGHPLRLWYGHG